MPAQSIPVQFLDALPEPAFMFAHDGRLEFMNNNAQSFLAATGMGGGRDLTHARLCKNLDLRNVEGEEHLMVGDAHYRVLQSSAKDQTLVRFFPAQENLHLLRLCYSLDIMPWGLVTVDVSGKNPVVLYGNARAGDFLNAPERELFGEDAHVLFSGLGEWVEIHKRLNSSQKSTYAIELFRKGKQTWYNLHFTPYVRKTMYCLVVIEDATEEKIMEGQYISAQRLEALGKLAGGVAHDFNNILSIIDGYARMARKNADMPEKVTDYGEKIASSVQRGAVLTQKLLAFGRQKETRVSVFDLGFMVLEQEPLLRPLLDASIQLLFDVDDHVYIEAGLDDVAQILMNLCLNARDAMPDGGAISVSVKQLGENAILSIADTGFGMDEKTKIRMFDPFFTTKALGKGTGLGLSMVYGLVQDFGGRINVKTAQGQGTTIDISFPLAKASEISQAGRDAQEDGAISLKGYTALIAEDEPELLNLVCGMVEGMGIRVLKATNGQDALVRQDEYEGRIDFLLTDVVMPELNGVKLAELFQAVRPESKIMFMSGYPQGEEMTRVRLPEDAILLSKPVSFDSLSSLLCNVTKKSHQIDIRG